MKDVNKLILVGRLGADPALRQTKNAIPVAAFSIATNYKLFASKHATAEVESKTELKGEESENSTRIAQWHRIVVFGKRAEWCAGRLGRGDSVFVEGTLRSHTFEKEAGVKREIFEVFADEVTLLKKAGARTEPTPVDTDEDGDQSDLERENEFQPVGSEFPTAATIDTMVH